MHGARLPSENIPHGEPTREVFHAENRRAAHAPVACTPTLPSPACGGGQGWGDDRVVAAHLMAAHERCDRRPFAAAWLARPLAARMKAASRRRVNERRNLAGDLRQV